MADTFLNELAWQRSSQPVLSAMTTEQTWCRVTLYNPTVVKVDGRYEMWYLGNSSATRNNDMDLGYAESEDGLHWTAFPNNPILRTGETPWAKRGRPRTSSLMPMKVCTRCGS